MLYRSVVGKAQLTTTTSAHLPAFSITHMTKKHSQREKNKFCIFSQGTGLVLEKATDFKTTLDQEEK